MSKSLSGARLRSFREGSQQVKQEMLSRLEAKWVEQNKENIGSLQEKLAQSLNNMGSGQADAILLEKEAVLSLQRDKLVEQS